VAVLDGSNQTIQTYMRGSDLSGSMAGAGGAGGLLEVGARSNGVHFATLDGNGNVSGLLATDGSGSTATYEYGPFGESIRESGPMASVNLLRFSTQFTDDCTASVKYLYREYLPSIGRWLSRDPIEETGGDHIYSFIRNEPLSSVDYLGLKVINAGPANLHDPNPDEDDVAPYKIVATASASLDYPDRCRGRAFVTLVITAAPLRGGNPVAEMVLRDNPIISPAGGNSSYSRGTLSIRIGVPLTCGRNTECNTDVFGEVTVRANPALRLGGAEGRIFARATYTIRLTGGCYCRYRSDFGTNIAVSFGGL
jgi:RHS repeat-associated protein